MSSSLFYLASPFQLFRAPASCRPLADYLNRVLKDTLETIWLETLWQSACPDKKSQLDLPVTVRYRHPLSIVIAHLRHGEAVWTGWKQEPVSLDDRDHSMCNISCETH